MSELSDVINAEHTWRGGYVCDCGEPMNSPRTYQRHLLEVAEPILDAREAAWRGEVDGLRFRNKVLETILASHMNLHVPHEAPCSRQNAPEGAPGGTTPGSAAESRRSAHTDADDYAWPTSEEQR